jgi:hypothetical protein
MSLIIKIILLNVEINYSLGLKPMYVQRVKLERKNFYDQFFFCTNTRLSYAEPDINAEQGRQCRQNVKLRRVLVTIAAV